MRARNKARIAEDTSDLNTGEENNMGNPEKKRKRVKKVLSTSSSDSEFEDSILPLPPKIKRIKPGNLMVSYLINFKTLNYISKIYNAKKIHIECC